MLNILNEQLFFLINRGAGQSVFLDNFFIFVTNFFVPAIIAVTLIWFFFVLPKRARSPIERLNTFKKAALLSVSLLVVWPVVEFIKGIIAFPRPQQLLTGVHALSNFGGYDSFPSLHTAFAFAIAMFIYHYYKGAGTIMFFLAGLVGLSRIFVGVHFPLDVICGALIGVSVPWGIISVFRRSGV